ncbi:Protein STRUBBELIG-RECEPTOR FAMILY 7 [Capsicum chinense]|nr:Protein STRUBBELIG-RECEPTOR FAMILY 7 [Capsicum chinense]
MVVKRLKDVGAGKEEFEQQMEIVGSIKHKNVVKLRVSEGSVAAMLHDSSKCCQVHVGSFKSRTYMEDPTQEEDNFLEAVSNMSWLRCSNIVQLIGYCAEHWQRLLVYDHVTNGSLHDMLYFADERSELLTWNARVRVALGTARTIEYVIAV